MIQSSVQTDADEHVIHEEFFGDQVHKLLFLILTKTAMDSSASWSNPGLLMKGLEIARDRGWENVSRAALSAIENLKVESTLDAHLTTLFRCWKARSLIGEAKDTFDLMAPGADPFEVERQLKARYGETPLGDAEKVLVYGDTRRGAYLETLLQRVRKYQQGDYRPLNFLWPSWNERLDPLAPGKYFLMLIPHGQGKSTVCANLAEYWAARKFHVAYVMTEDPPIDFEDRQTARWAGVPWRKLREGSVTPEELKRIKEKREWLEDAVMPYLHYVKAYGKSLQELLHYLRCAKDSGRLDVAVVDYLNSIKKDQPRRRGSEADWQIKGEAEEFVSFSSREQVPLFIADQFSKAGEKDILSGNTDGISGYGRAQNGHCASTILAGCRPKVKQLSGEWLDGRQIAQFGDNSAIMNWCIAKQNNGRHGLYKQLFLGPVYRLKDLPNENADPDSRQQSPAPAPSHAANTQGGAQLA